MISSVSSNQASFVGKNPEVPASKKETPAGAAALPIIASLGDQARIVGDDANPACIACWTACLAIPACAPTAPLVCAAMCVPPFSA